MKLKVLGFVFCIFSVHVLWAQNLVLPPKIDLFQYSASVSGYYLSEKPDIRIWGWSRDGKVAYSLESVGSFSGILSGNFVVFDAISDRIVYELSLDASYHSAGEPLSAESLYNLYGTNISNAIRTYNITGTQYDFLRFPIRRNNMVYDCQLTDVVYKNHNQPLGFFNNRFVSSYNVVITANNKRKVIGNYVSAERDPGALFICGYFLSPFEERALVVVAEEAYTFEGETKLTYRFNGCHLGVGFN